MVELNLIDFIRYPEDFISNLSMFFLPSPFKVTLMVIELYENNKHCTIKSNFS